MSTQRLIGGHVSMAGGVEHALTNGKLIGANCVQFFAGSPRSWERRLFTDEEIEHFKAKQKEFEIEKVFIHALYLVNLASATDTLTKSMQALEYDLKNAQNLGAEGVVIHIGGYSSSWNEVKTEVIKRIESLSQLAPRTTCILENSAGQKGKIGSLEELSEIVQEIKTSNIGICLDTAHLFEAGFNLTNKDIVDNLINKITQLQLLEKLSCIHLNDSKTAVSSHRDIHANLGEGHIGLKGLKQFATCVQLGHLPIILEVPGDPAAKQKGPRAQDIATARSLAGVI